MTSSRDRPSDHLGWVRWIGTVLVLLLCALAVLLGAGTNATTATTHAYDLAIKDASTHLAQAPATAERQPLPVELAATRAWEPSSIAPVVAAEGEAQSSDTIHSTVAAADDDSDPQEVMRNAQDVYYDENGDQVYVWDQGDGSAEITIRNPSNGNIVTNQTSTSDWVGEQLQSGRWWSLNG